MKVFSKVLAVFIAVILLNCTAQLFLFAQEKSKKEEAKEEPELVKPGPNRKASEGEGPFKRLIIRGAIVIDGTGAPPRGPMDIVIEGNRIEEVKSVGSPGVPIKEKKRPDRKRHV